MWERNLVLQLTWKVQRTVYRRTGGTTTRRIQQYVAPSWSWASMAGSFEVSHGLDPIKLRSRGPVRRKLATIIDVQLQYVNENPYGQVRSGNLRIQGITSPVRISEVTERNRSYDHYTTEFNGIVLSRAEPTFDVEPQALPQDLIFLPLFEQGAPSPGIKFHGLLLIPVEEQGKDVYQRAGVMMLSHNESLYDAASLVNSMEASRRELMLI